MSAPGPLPTDQDEKETAHELCTPTRLAMIPFDKPASIARRAFPDPLPSLSAVLLQNRMMSSATANCEEQAIVTNYAIAFPPPIMLEDSDWDDLVGSSTAIGDYISPDVAGCLDGDETAQGSQDLDIFGHEFLMSPSIPVIGSVPRAITTPQTFGVALAQFRSDEDIQSSSIIPKPIERDGTSAKAPLRKLRARTESIGEDRAAAGVLRSLNFRASGIETRALTGARAGRSARVRLFASPDNDGKENRPKSVPSDQPPAKNLTKLKPKPTASSKARRHSSGPPNSAKKTPSPRRSKSAKKFKACILPGCEKGARSKGLCKRHGGGKRCSFPECFRSDQGGGFCISHGGGKRCIVKECGNSAQSKGLCKSHGGGRRCSVVNCTKSAQGGGLCRMHARGTLVKTAVCTNGACPAHRLHAT